MQLTSFTDYGLRALIYMASLPEGKMTSISEVTEVYGVSRNHMVKIINQLSRAGLIMAVRGKTVVSGWAAIRPPFASGMWCESWSHCRWLTAARNFVISPLPAA